jgi:hypothetical protein
MPKQSQVHVDSMLTNISVAYIQDTDAFIADKVFPNVPVEKKSDRYFVYDKDDFMRDEAKERAAGTESATGDYNIDNTPSYFARRYAFNKKVTDEDITNSDSPLKPFEDATNFVTHKMLLARERIFATKFFVPSVWGTNVGGVASSPTAGTSFIKWSDYSSSTPGKDIRYLKKLILSTTSFKPNTLTISYDVYSTLLDHPAIKDNIKYVMVANPGQVTSVLAQYFDIPKLVVAESVVNTAAKGATANTGFQLSNRALLTYAPASPGLQTPSAGYIFPWKGLLGSGAYGNAISRWWNQDLKSYKVEGEMCFDAKIVCADLGAYLSDVI